MGNEYFMRLSLKFFFLLNFINTFRLWFDEIEVKYKMRFRMSSNSLNINHLPMIMSLLSKANDYITKFYCALLTILWTLLQAHVCHAHNAFCFLTNEELWIHAFRLCIDCSFFFLFSYYFYWLLFSSFLLLFI